MAQFVSLNGLNVAVEEVVMDELGLKPGQKIADHQFGAILEGNLYAARAVMALSKVESARRKRGG